MLDDSEILDLYVRRSEEAIIHTAEKYERYCHSIAYNILTSNEESDECVNDTYFRAWNAIPPNIPQRLAAFLGKITRNLALNRYEKRKAAKRGTGQIELALSELEECVDMQSDVENESNRRLLTEAVNRFLAEQTKEKCEIFVQRYWYLMSIKQISEQSGTKENQIKSVLFRMRAELKEHLKKKDLI